MAGGGGGWRGAVVVAAVGTAAAAARDSGGQVETDLEGVLHRLKNKKIQHISVLRIRDVHTGSAILIFGHPGSRISDPKTARKREG